VKLGTRGSQLARWQAEWVRDRLAAQGGRPRAEIVVIKTRGDAEVDRPLHELEERGFSPKRSRTRCSTAASMSPCTR